MNLKLQHVVSDVTSVTGLAILQAILSGERHPQKLAQLRDRPCQQSEAEIARALQGNWCAAPLFALPPAVELSEFYHRQLALWDRQSETPLQTLPDHSGGKPLAAVPHRAPSAVGTSITSRPGCRSLGLRGWTSRRLRALTTTPRLACSVRLART